MELSKGWSSLDTVIAADGLALTLMSTGNLKEAQELFERCLDARKSLLPPNHIQISGNMLQIARVAMLNFDQSRKKHISEAIAEVDRAKELLDNSTRIARHVLNKSMKQKGYKQNYEVSGGAMRDGRAAFVILLQSLQALGLLEITKQELQETRGENLPIQEAENAIFECISTYKEFETLKSISDTPQAKAEYLSCLKHLVSLIGKARASETKKSREATLQGLKNEIKRVEGNITVPSQ